MSDFIQKTIDEQFNDVRIDKFLSKTLPKAPRNYVYRIIRQGLVKVNDQEVKSNHRVFLGDVVTIPPEDYVKASSRTKVPDEIVEHIKDRVVYENGNLLIINKPVGMRVHGGRAIDTGLIEAVRALYPENQYLQLVHRLDRETSGCTLIAKKATILKECHDLFENRQVDKTYHALVVGRWPEDLTEVEASLLKKKLKFGERIVEVDPSGKPALTQFKVLEYFDDYTLIEAKPVTGRPHQIRVHAQHAGYPIVGDEKYTSPETNDQLLATLPEKRMYLHAYQLAFELKSNGDEICATSDGFNTLS